MERAEKITDEFEQKIKGAIQYPALKKLTIPFRLFLCWMRETNQRLSDLEQINRNI